MAKGEAGAMEGVWSHGAEVTALHPIGGRETASRGFASLGCGTWAEAARVTARHLLA